MGRNPKQGIDYFPVDVDMFNDRKIKRLLRSAGGKGFTIYMNLLTDIYRDKGYYYEWDKHSAFDISDALNFSESVVEETVKACCSIGLFNELLFTEKSIISSESIQNRWKRIVRDAGRTITDINQEIKIEGGKPVFLGDKSDKQSEKPSNQPEKQHKEKKSKVKKRKEKKSKEENAREVNLFTGIDHKQLHRLKEPLTSEQLEKLRDQFSDDTVRDVLIAMENHKKLTTKYTSAYLTAINWCKRRDQKNDDYGTSNPTKGDRRVRQLREHYQ